MKVSCLLIFFTGLSRTTKTGTCHRYLDIFTGLSHTTKTGTCHRYLDTATSCPTNGKGSAEVSGLTAMTNRYSEVEIGVESDSSSGDEEEEAARRYAGPKIRSPLVRAMYNRMQDDRRSKTSTHVEWYAIDTTTYPDDIKTLFVQCYQDNGTTQFLENCYEKSDWIFTQMYQGFMKSVLTWFMTVTSANAFLGRGSMFVFSTEQFRRLMRIDENYLTERMIDLGAGDGKVTQMMAQHYQEVYTTEVSTWMQSRLRAAGYKVLSVEAWPHLQYDLISCLNLLDRCDRPHTILADIRAALRPGGRVILALVLPYVPYVETTNDHQPSERLPIKGSTFKEQVLSLVQDVFVPAGFSLVSYSRLPYLCEGDIYRSFYVLNDAVFVLKLDDS